MKKHRPSNPKIVGFIERSLIKTHGFLIWFLHEGLEVQGVVRADDSPACCSPGRTRRNLICLVV